jgi:hypothetical protein
MFSRLRTAALAFIILIATTIGVSPVQAAKRLPNQPHYSAHYRSGRPVLYGYGFAPYLYYESYGFNGIQGAPNAYPLQFGYGESTFGSSDFSFGSSDFSFGSSTFGY